MGFQMPDPNSVPRTERCEPVGVALGSMSLVLILKLWLRWLRIASNGPWALLQRKGHLNTLKKQLLREGATLSIHSYSLITMAKPDLSGLRIPSTAKTQGPDNSPGNACMC